LESALAARRQWTSVRCWGRSDSPNRAAEPPEAQREEDEEGTVYVEFYTKGDLTLSLPSLARIIVSPLVVMEFNGLVDRYVENLQKTFAKTRSRAR